MIGSLRSIAALAIAAVVCTSCSGGGTNATATPNVAPGQPDKAKANITIRYTQGTHHVATHSGRRSPRFVDPAGTTLVVDSSSTTNATFFTTTTITVAPGGDGTQAINAPIVASPGASDTTFITVTEFDSSGNPLAIGQASLTSVQPGTSVTAPAITLYMVPSGIGITVNPASGNGAVALSSDPLNPTSFRPSLGCPGTAYLFAFDAQGSWASQFGSPLGVGGIPTPQIVSQKSDGVNGTSRLASVQGGGFMIVSDGNGDGVTAHVQTFDINPNDNNIAQVTADGYVDFLPPSC